MGVCSAGGRFVFHQRVEREVGVVVRTLEELVADVGVGIDVVVRSLGERVDAVAVLVAILTSWVWLASDGFDGDGLEKEEECR
jgi:hypothetical protein